jgi:hypothetical protein
MSCILPQRILAHKYKEIIQNMTKRFEPSPSSTEESGHMVNALNPSGA